MQATAPLSRCCWALGTHHGGRAPSQAGDALPAQAWGHPFSSAPQCRVAARLTRRRLACMRVHTRALQPPACHLQPAHLPGSTGSQNTLICKLPSQCAPQHQRSRTYNSPEAGAGEGATCSAGSRRPPRLVSGARRRERPSSRRAGAAVRCPFPSPRAAAGTIHTTTAPACATVHPQGALRMQLHSGLVPCGAARAQVRHGKLA